MLNPSHSQLFRDQTCLLVLAGFKRNPSQLDINPNLQFYRVAS